MNKVIVIIMFFCFNCLYSQLDTLNYLKQFEANKANYIGQPFSQLLNDMTEIQPKTVWSLPIGTKKTISTDSRFKFTLKEYSFYKPITLLIVWAPEIPRDQTEYYEKKNKFYFTNDEKNFYGSKIIKDIIVYRY
ncbi:hypothetical protein [Chryseobacterium sp. CT-SW4]|uniref:hypothetical protein n=1 Tax=Chryseobacterium sp. SW-1 TaxID=3157343 RepID=UPI003B01BA34